MLVDFESVRVMCIIACVNLQDPLWSQCGVSRILIATSQDLIASELAIPISHDFCVTVKHPLRVGRLHASQRLACPAKGLCFTSEHETTGLSPTLQQMPIVGWRAAMHGELPLFKGTFAKRSGHAFLAGMQNLWRDSNLLRVQPPGFLLQNQRILTTLL